MFPPDHNYVSAPARLPARLARLTPRPQQFCFYYKLEQPLPPEVDGWKLVRKRVAAPAPLLADRAAQYNPVDEFARMGVPNMKFRLTHINKDVRAARAPARCSMPS